MPGRQHGTGKHYMCQGCWFAKPGNVMFDIRNVAIGAVAPPNKNRVSRHGLYTCCICAGILLNGVLFDEDPRHDELDCDHDEDGLPQRVQGYYRMGKHLVPHSPRQRT